MCTYVTPSLYSEESIHDIVVLEAETSISLLNSGNGPRMPVPSTPKLFRSFSFEKFGGIVPDNKECCEPVRGGGRRENDRCPVSEYPVK